MSREPTQALADFAAGLTYEAIPERVRDHCKDLLLDALACAVAGHRGEETHQLAALASGLAQSSESSVIGGDRLSLAGATLLNGYLITAVTMCDAHRATLTHITPEVVPPALAIAERDALSGRDLLVALAAGCEVTTRIGIGLDFAAFRARGWHGPGILGPFGAAAAVGRLLRFDAETMARAFGLAGSQAAGTFAAWGTPTVKFHQCRGALSGLMAALLAEQKFLATREFLTARDGGLYNSLCRRWPPRGRHRRSRQTLGARTDRAAPVAVGLVDPGHDDGDVRDRGEAQDRSRAGEDAARRAEPAGLCHARKFCHLQRRSSRRSCPPTMSPPRSCTTGSSRSPSSSRRATTIRNCAASPSRSR